MILQTQGLCKTFGGVAAIAGIDFNLKQGELRCLIGANGAGKSTFFKMLTGQITPTSGRIVIKGQDVTGWPSFKIARLGVGIKTQVPSLFDGLTVSEHLHLSALRKVGARRAEEATCDMLAEMELEALADASVGTLAHGQRQWVELGMVLVGDPDIVLLDEPAAGMTQAELQTTISLLDKMRGRRTIIIVEHDMNFIRQIAETVTVFHRGRVLVEDTMDGISRNAEVREAYLGQKGLKDHG
ncbi:MAG TPA: ATP-binding cassette domain-containing protein [Xanthobacteraceae bacterium]|nr:ATP-binding cassette domain-containing protein [Xanthobacteraceae bacterium]